ncbi:MAG: T9SS type A sorting domain-containing protein, partial [Bacteroidetes bacterium]|nr:T9SS type A sorting domain-containing protein [Bacteroidota bacterium]
NLIYIDEVCVKNTSPPPPPDSCECAYDPVILTQGDSSYVTLCNLHGAQDLQLGCPARDITIGGFFGCINSATGELCDETEVWWELDRPGILTSFTGITTNFPAFFFPASDVSAPGLYCLTRWTVCPGSTDTCVCKIRWIQPECPDSCCTSYEDFCERIENNVTVTVDNNLCKATLNIGDIGCDDYIEWVDWDFPSQQQGSYFPGDMPMHSYSGSSTYVICYLAIERDTNGLICFEKLVCDTIDILCPDSCECIEADNLSFIAGDSLGNLYVIPVICNDSSIVSLPCSLTTGGSFWLHGDVHCSSDDCLGDDFEWENVNEATGIGFSAVPSPLSSNDGQNGHFDILLSYSLFTPGDTYTLTVTHYCGGKACTCSIRFVMAECDSCACSAGTATSPNLVTNGDFEQGDNYFSSGLISDMQCGSDTYWVDDNFTDKCSGWPSLGDHTTGTGNFMIVDGASNPTSAPVVWSQQVNFVQGMSYCLSFWTASVYCDNQQDFVLQVDIGSFFIPNSPTYSWVGQPNIVEPCQSGQPFVPTWIHHSYTWTCPTGFNGPYTLFIRQLSGDAYTDFGIDDICLTKIDCCSDEAAFIQAVEAATYVTIDPMLCKATLNIDNLPCNDYIEWINWGDGSPLDNGNYPSGSMPMHTYANSGPYTITWLAIEKDANGQICFEHVFTETVNCSGCAIPPPGLIAWWRMEEQTGDPVVADFVGPHPGTPKPGGTVGTPSGPNPVAGKVNGALQFNSPGNTHVEVSSVPDLNFGAGDFTIDAWINTDMGTQTEPIVDKLGNLNSGYAFSIQGTSPANYFPTLVIGTGSTVEVLQGTTPIVAGDWNFVAVAVNPPTVTFFVGNASTGGNLIQSPAFINGTPNASNTRNLLIGNNPSNPHWDIMIDELEIFDRALTIQQLNPIWLADELGKCTLITGCFCATLESDVNAGFTFMASGPEYLFQPVAMLEDCDQVTWNWGDGSPASMSIGSAQVAHSFTETASFNVSMTVLRTEQNGETCSETASMTVTDAGSLSETSAIRLFPNPTSGRLTLEFTGATPKAGTVQILDLYGRQLISQALLPGEQSHSFSIAALSAGMYFVQVLEDGVPVWTRKVVKQ